MMRWISITAIGSTPANGSSSRMKRGCVASARAISTRRRSPPESASAGVLAQVRDVAGPSSSSLAARASIVGRDREPLQLEHRAACSPRP